MYSTNRAERRHQRERIIAHRRALRICIPRWPEQVWGQYSKWNGNCGSTRCHYHKYFKCAAKRRRALKTSESQAEFRRRNKRIE